MKIEEARNLIQKNERNKKKKLKSEHQFREKSNAVFV